MATAIAAIRAQFARIWGGMGKVQKSSVGVIVAVALAALGVFVFMSSRPSYVTVFSNLNEQDAAAIVAKLKSTKTDYETTDGGKTIKVARAKQDVVCLTMANSGRPQYGVNSYEIREKTNFSTKDINNK